VNLETGVYQNNKIEALHFLTQFGRVGYLVDETPFQFYPQLCKRILPCMPISSPLIPQPLVKDISRKSPLYRFGAYFFSSAGELDLAEGLMEKISTPYNSRDNSKSSTFEKQVHDDSSVEIYEIPQIERTSRRLVDLTKGRSKLGRVLDIGCGTGMTSALIKNKAGLIHGIDINSVYLAAAEKKGIYKQLNQVDILKWQDFSSKYDTILSCMLTYVISDLKKLLSIISALLEDQGRAYIDFLTVNGPANQRKADGYYLRTRAFIMQAIEENGLRIVRDTIGPNQFAVGTYTELTKVAK
jgi:SAM-dependent methyltransferase